MTLICWLRDLDFDLFGVSHLIGTTPSSSMKTTRRSTCRICCTLYRSFVKPANLDFWSLELRAATHDPSLSADNCRSSFWRYFVGRQCRVVCRGLEVARRITFAARNLSAELKLRYVFSWYQFLKPDKARYATSKKFRVRTRCRIFVCRFCTPVSEQCLMLICFVCSETVNTESEVTH